MEEVKNYSTTDKDLLDELDQDVGEASWKNWKQKVERERIRQRERERERERAYLWFDAVSVPTGDREEIGWQREVF